MKATELTGQSSNKEAELLESRKWQFLEICKVFGVPPWLIDGTYDVKYGGLEQAMTVFLNFTLMPYLRHLEQKFATLLTPYEQDAYYFEFDFSVLLRADEKARGEFYRTLWGMGVLSANQIAAKENIDPAPEAGDVHFVPAQNMPLTQEVIDAYMAGAKLKAAQLVAGGPVPPDPALAAGSQAQ
jgi:HK97 family phage portal protein